jgi:hypothetical protein
MSSIIYANIGFRCESAYKEFSDYLENHKEINKIILEDSKKILKDCLRIENDERHSIYLTSPSEAEVESILYDYINEKKDKNIILKLKRIVGYIDNVESLKQVQIVELCSFFKDIVELCKDKSQQNLLNETGYGFWY